MKVYIAYEGYHNIRHAQVYNVLGVYVDRGKAIERVEQNIGSLDGIDVEERGSTMFWIDNGMEIIDVGKVEEHEVIEEYSEPTQGVDFTKINPMDLAFTVEQLEALKKI
jgi:hypothetical protein